MFSVPRNSFPQTTPDLIEGWALNARESDIITLPNSALNTLRSATITPGVATQEVTVYRLLERATGQLIVAAASDSTPTAIEASNLIRAAIRANAVVNGLVTLNADGNGTVVVTQRPGAYVDIDFVDGGSTPTNVVTVVTTAATNSPVIPRGRAVTSPSTKPDSIQLISATLSATNILRGFSISSYFDQYDLATEGYQPRDPGAGVLRKGPMTIRCQTNWTPLSDVWLIFSGANAGTLRTSDSGGGDNIKIFGGITFGNSGSAGGIAKINVSLDALRLS